MHEQDKYVVKTGGTSHLPLEVVDHFTFAVGLVVRHHSIAISNADLSLDLLNSTQNENLKLKRADKIQHFNVFDPFIHL